jgi:hypothetical protein
MVEASTKIVLRRNRLGVIHDTVAENSSELRPKLLALQTLAQEPQ